MRQSVRGSFKLTGLQSMGGLGEGAWIRDTATIAFPLNQSLESVELRVAYGEFREEPHSNLIKKPISLEVSSGDRREVFELQKETGKHSLRIGKGSGFRKGEQLISLKLRGVGWTNFYALLGRKLEKSFLIPKSWREWLQPFRRQMRNRRVLLRSIDVNGEILVRFDAGSSVFDPDFILKHGIQGVNLVGWFTGFLGVGESARSCARSFATVDIEATCIDMKLKLNGKASKELWKQPLAASGSYPISIAHVDAPQSADLARIHDAEFGKNQYRIGYWAWELPQFPDEWIQFAGHFDEIWCPSEFCRQAMAEKLPVPVQVMPHAISVVPPESPEDSYRNQFGLPQDDFLFLFNFDFNSYALRKNPMACLEAFFEAFGSNAKGVGLVIKAHGQGYSDDRSRFYSAIEGRKNVFVIDDALSRNVWTELQFTTDAYVSLHRSEGFGLGVAEMMALGKPVIATDWSATAEFLNPECGCPVKYDLVELEKSVGPYRKGQIWAEPDVEHAADWMQRLVNDQVGARGKGRKASGLVQNRFSPKTIGQRYLKRLKSIALFE